MLFPGTVIERIMGLALLALVLNACNVQENLHPDIHGHRGSRGTLPENSLPSFLRAIELGCDFVELDVVLTKDGQVVISHEPWMEPSICLTPEGERIPADQGRTHNIYEMTLAEVQRYDCGSIPNPRFPEQEQMISFKPSLRELVEAADEHALLSGMASPSYNIEIKSDPEWYGILQPDPKTYAAAVLATIDSLGIGTRCIVQSFDPAILEAVHEQYPSIRMALLIENKDGLEKNLERLSFKPDIYSPAFAIADADLLKELRAKDIELLVWTVNEKEDIVRMLDLGVDGIITDYPERVIKLLEERE